MRVWLEPMKMAAYGLTVQDVERAIREENAEGRAKLETLMELLREQTRRGLAPVPGAPGNGRGRHPLHASAIQRAVSHAGRRSGIGKRVTCHTFRHVDAGSRGGRMAALMG